MRKIFLPLILLFISSSIFGQTPGIQWQQTIGAEKDDIPSFSLKTTDNQIITIGSTNSLTGAYAGNHGGSDIWIEKRNLQGILQWRTLLGGAGTDIPVDYYYNSDGSIMLLGTTTSNTITSYHGATDILVAKIDNAGSLVWQRCYGGSNNENAGNIIKTSDGNYVISGTSSSNNGNLTANAGGQDIWVFKIDGGSAIQWQKNFGGSGQEGNTKIKVMQASDASIYFLTETASNNGNVSGNNGGSDMWLVKLNSSGTLQWQKCLGGTGTEYSADLKETASGDIYAVGNTNSAFPSFHGYSDFYVCRVSSAGALAWQKCFGGTLDDVPQQIVSTEADDSFVLGGYVNNGGGDVIGYSGYATGHDIWIVKISGIGDIQWQKDLGGFGPDLMSGRASNQKLATGGVIQTADQGFLVTAFAETGNNKTNWHTQEMDSSRSDIWIVKLTSSGTLDWERCFGGYFGDLPQGLAVELGNNDFIITGSTNSYDGDISHNFGAWDGWLFRLGAVNTITGTVFLDNNSNGVKDTGEPFYSNVTVQSQKTGDVRVGIPYGGLFINEVDTGAYATTVTLNIPYYNVVPSSFSSAFSTYFNKDSVSFALQPIPNKQDLMVNLIPVTAARPGFNSTYRIFYRNVGTTTISSGEILLKRDHRTGYLSSIPALSGVAGDTLKWAYTNFAPGDTASVFVTLQVATPPTVNAGDTLSYIAIINPAATDETPANDTAVLKQRTVGSIDPNDKTENNGGLIGSSFITAGSYLQYTVRFQNTGTADAITVIVRDTLGSRVDLSTLEVVTASHPYTLSIENGNQLIWTFNDIMLPASSVNEPASHGYIVYRIRPKSDVVVGETIHNTASIYFDYNLPVMTNDALTLVQDNFTPLPVKLLSFTGQLTNSIAELHWQTANETNFERFEVERSVDGASFSRTGSVAFANSVHDYKATDNVQGLQSKHIFYRLKLIDADGKFSYSKVIAFNIDAVNRFTVYPNPANTEMFVSITADKKTNLQLKIIDASGRMISNEQRTIQKGNNVFPVNTSTLKKGNYILQLATAEEIRTTKFTIMN